MLAFLMELNAVCLYNACLFLLDYFALDFCIVIVYAMLLVSMVCFWFVDT